MCITHSFVVLGGDKDLQLLVRQGQSQPRDPEGNQSMLYCVVLLNYDAEQTELTKCI